MRRQLIGLLAGGGLLLGMLVVNDSSDTNLTHRDDDSLRPVHYTGAPHTVTLVSGDRVSLAGDNVVRIEPGPGRTGTKFLTRRVNEHMHVVPLDALPLLRSGRLDERLFDVTTLVDHGYDERRADTPLLIIHNGASAMAMRTVKGARATREIPALNAQAVRAAKNATLWQELTGDGGRLRAAGSSIAKVWLDGLRRPTLDASVPQIGAPAAWQAGYDGTGTTVAVLDTGIDATHPDLAGRVSAVRNFVEEFADARDTDGHGTHVASTIAGSGAASAGRYRGVAPGAKVLDGKVCFEGKCPESAILAGMQWATEQGAAVVNMSLGSADTPGTDPLEAAVDTLTERHGTLFVVAAGNDGADRSVGSPASADAALAVGAVDGSDRLAAFSSRGPRIGDAGLKPDITAPGVAISAARGRDAGIGEPGQPYVTLDGTSMATPHVAGAAAILRQRRPDWSSARLKAGLLTTAQPTAGVAVFSQGAGRLDVGRAVDASVLAEPASIGFGHHAWPHADDAPVGRTVTYRNEGAAPVRLTLAVQAFGPDGKAAPADMFRLDATAIDVPAGGQSTVRFTADTRVGSIDGLFGGWVVATAGDTVLRTPFGAEREVESYDLTIVHIGRDGAPALDGYWQTMVHRIDKRGDHFPYDPDGTVTIRLPKGVYSLSSTVFDQSTATLLVQPRLDLIRAHTVTVDARTGRPVDVSVPQPDAALVSATVQASIADGPSIQVTADRFDQLFTGQLGPDRSADGFWSKISGTWARPAADGSLVDTPYVYNVAYFNRGRMFPGLTRHIAAKDLATVRAGHFAQVPNAGANKTAYAAPVDGVVGESGFSVPMRLPSTRIEYYNTDGGTRWRSTFDELTLGDDGFPVGDVGGLMSPWRTFKGGSTRQEDWNRPVFGPAFGQPAHDHEYVSRSGDAILVLPWMFGDSSGRAGYATLDEGRIALYRDGTLVGEVASSSDPVEFNVPAGSAAYRLTISGRRAAGAPSSTQVSGEWTFRSGHVNGARPVRLPLLTVTFAPNVDAQQSVQTGSGVLVPVSVAAQPGSGAGLPRSLVVAASYDDGRTWRDAPVVGAADARAVKIDHVAGAQFVSLRAKATDDRGNAVEQTILRAYRIAGSS